MLPPKSETVVALGGTKDVSMINQVMFCIVVLQVKYMMGENLASEEQAVPAKVFTGFINLSRVQPRLVGK